MLNSLDLNQSPYIKDIQKGFLERGYFLLKKINLNMGKKNKPYLRLLLADKTGHLPAVYFGHEKELKEMSQELSEGSIVLISGIVEEYQSMIQIKLINIKKSKEPELELSRFWKRTPFDRRELYKKLRSMLQKIQQPKLHQLCLFFLKDRSFMKLFLEAPASRFIHHAYIGGLLEHTLHVVELVAAYASVFELASRDLLLAGAFLHDIGKVDEYDFLFQIDHSSLGKLKGHTLLGYERLQKKLEKLEIEPSLRLKLEHILLAHQGKRIWGAIEEPRFLEAYLVHAADSTDSSQFIYSQAKKDRDISNLPYASDFVSYLNREIYLA